ncbi:hypothetical protein GEMRC1_007122 [Eukaryota sp. GEM-RC1]
MFVFDVFGFVDSIKDFACFVVDRKDFFAPVKNPPIDGLADSPLTAKQMILDLHRRWISTRLGVNGFSKEVTIEVSPSISVIGENLPYIELPTFGTFVLELEDGKPILKSCE